MIETIRPAEMMALEQAYMQEYAVPAALLMEHAAQGVVNALRRHVTQGSPVLFLCGAGSNGGDGYAAARLWQYSGGQAFLIACGTPTGNAAMNRTLALQSGVPEVPAETDFTLFAAVVDALFGTGLNRAPTGEALHLILRANACRRPIIAVDVPSGLDADTGLAPGEAIRARETVTFHRVKQGLLLRDGPTYTGKVTRYPILIPEDYGSTPGLRMAEDRDYAPFRTRPVTAHKGTMGRVLVIAGSVGMAGAAAFCANAAIHAGAGLTRILCLPEILPTLQQLAPCATCIPLPEEESRWGEATEEALRSADAAAVGCGMGQDLRWLPVLRAVREAKAPAVWDADALNLASEAEELLPLRPGCVVTPHPGEAARLLHTDVHKITADPLAALAALCERCGCAAVLKGTRSLMGDGRVTAIQPFGSPGLAKGGSGDVLCGILAAFLARKDLEADLLTRVQLGVWLHNRAAQLTEEACGKSAVTAPRVIARLGNA